jgi:hypothetical protein
LPFGPVSTDPTLGSVAEASLIAVLEAPDPVGAAFVVVEALCVELHAAATTAIAASVPSSAGRLSRELA